MKGKPTRSPGPRRKRPPATLRPPAVADPYYILASSPRADETSRVLKDGETFAIFDHFGDIRPTGLGEEGLYHEGTRFLSCLLLGLGKDRPLALSSTVKEDNDLLAIDLTNHDMARDGHVAVPRGTLHISRMKLLWRGVCYERLRVRNYGLAPVDVAFTLRFAADFVDIFEVRGSKRTRRGEYLEPDVEDGAVGLGYRGLDGVTRRTRLSFRPAPTELSEDEAAFAVSLLPQQEATIYLTVACVVDGTTPPVLGYDQAINEAVAAVEAAKSGTTVFSDANKSYSAWVNRAAADLHMLVAQTPEGPYPFAGVPWFSTPFGRDGIITALECLWLNPALARGVLAYLAATQATEVVPEQDAEPGKVLHETRGGEMAALKEIPFGRYYGSVDATPLFVFLAGAYYERTADRAFVESIWPHVEAALRWIDQYGDADDDGFVEYQRHSPTGLVHQGWKDSHDAIFHADGTLARPPIALCEVQGYVYAARRAAATLATALGQAGRAEELTRQAQALQERFEEAFWCEDLSTYAVALDGAKQPCRVRTSNAGHCLLTGIAEREHARRTAATLLDHDSFSGWGVRTVAASEARYNPMAYHNGSVWPHDNALIAYGLARYGLKEGVLQILNGLFDASLFLDLHRLPELFCGFPRRPGEGPTLYPVACSPQAWSAAAVFLLLQASLGLVINGLEKQLSFSYPLLPEFLKEVRLTNLRVGSATVDLRLLRHGQDVGINVLRREGDFHLMMMK
jgi:glycogen debranching enzyme